MISIVESAVLRVLLVLAVAAIALPAAALADQASQPGSPSAGQLGAGKLHTCTILSNGSVRCWGYGSDGALGYGNATTIGDDETPASAGPVDLGAGRTAKTISAGSYHTCVLLDDGTVRCWGFGGDGRLGYGNTNNLGATPATTPDKIGSVDLGAGRIATAISAGGSHTCAILDDGSVRCWGFGFDGELGYGNQNSIGKSQAPGSVGPVDLGAGRTAKAITAGAAHTCAILDDDSVRCWGFGGNGQLGYGNSSNVGDTPATTPDKVGPVDLGPGRTAVAISAGEFHTCAILDDGSVRCWGYGAYGQLAYGNTNDVTSPSKVGPVSLGPGRTAVAISAGELHTCALLDNNRVRCWGDGANGRLGYCSLTNVGLTPTTLPGEVGSVNLTSGDGGAGCAGSGPKPGGGGHGGGGHPVDQGLAAALRAEAARARSLRICLATTARRVKRQQSRARSVCVKRYGRTPGRVTRVQAKAISKTAIVLTFVAPGSDANRLPAARAYLIEQSTRPLRTPRDLQRGQTLCKGRCRFRVTVVGTRIKLTINHLRPHSTYYYAVVARDNVSGRLGPRSHTVQVRTR
ncbi:MAG: hypothetical protein ACR2QA_14710 [Solirubrobacteraceae bacterium]